MFAGLVRPLRGMTSRLVRFSERDRLGRAEVLSRQDRKTIAVVKKVVRVCILEIVRLSDPMEIEKKRVLMCSARWVGRFAAQLIQTNEREVKRY